MASMSTESDVTIVAAQPHWLRVPMRRRVIRRDRAAWWWSRSGARPVGGSTRSSTSRSVIRENVSTAEAPRSHGHDVAADDNIIFSRKTFCTDPSEPPSPPRSSGHAYLLCASRPPAPKKTYWDFASRISCLSCRSSSPSPPEVRTPPRSRLPDRFARLIPTTWTMPGRLRRQGLPETAQPLRVETRWP